MHSIIGWATLLLVAAVLVTVCPNTSAGEDRIVMTDYEGKVVLVDFWASWCVPCRRSFPWLDEMQSKYGDQGLVVIGVNMDADPREAEAFLQEFPVSFRIVRDADGSLARGYDVMAMPSSYLIDRNGDIIARHLGFHAAQVSTYETDLLAALGYAGAVEHTGSR